VTEQPDRNKCLISQAGKRIRLSCVSRVQLRTSSSFSLELLLRMRCRWSSLMMRDSSVKAATDSSSSSGKPGESICKSFLLKHSSNIEMRILQFPALMPCLALYESLSHAGPLASGSHAATSQCGVHRVMWPAWSRSRDPMMLDSDSASAI